MSLLLTSLSLLQLFTAAKEGRVHDVVQLLSGVGVNETDEVGVYVYQPIQGVSQLRKIVYKLTTNS